MRIASLPRFRPGPLFIRVAACAIVGMTAPVVAISLAVIGAGAILAVIQQPGCPFRW